MTMKTPKGPSEIKTPECEASGTIHCPVIVVAAFNRLEPLRRLLASLRSADYPAGATLVVSIDGGGDDRVFECADRFDWPHGQLQVVRHPNNLGLKQHILWCGDLTQEYGSIILLEDDLFVAPGFYRYATALLGRYAEDSRIAGISLYTNQVNHPARLPFVPLPDGNDVYFHQYGASWGQAWTAGQWGAFRDWYQRSADAADQQCMSDHLPAYVAGWDAGKSWLKFFNLYLVMCERWVVYPRVSYSTNYGDAGENCAASGTHLQTTLTLGRGGQLRLPDMDVSDAVYDPYFELDRSVLVRRCPFLDTTSVEANLHLKKDVTRLTSEYVLVPIELAEAEVSFGLYLKPIEMNVLMQGPGSDISLVKRERVPPAALQRMPTAVLRYYSGPMSVKHTLRSNLHHAAAVLRSRRLIP